MSLASARGGKSCRRDGTPLYFTGPNPCVARAAVERAAKGGRVVSYVGSLVCAAAAFCFALPSTALCQQQLPGPERTAAFELSISQDFTEDSKPCIVVNTSISYRRLVFFMRDKRYEARYRVYLEIADPRGKRVRGEVWEEAVVTADSRETTSAALTADSRRVFAVAAGEYEATVTIEVIDTSRRFSEKEAVRIVGEDSGRLELSTPAFFTMKGDSLAAKPRAAEMAVTLCPAGAGDGARGNAGALYGTFDAWARVVCGAVFPAARERSNVEVTTRVRDARGIIVLYRRDALAGVEGGHVSLCLDINVDDLPIGEYELGVVAAPSGGAEKSEAKGRFTVLFNRGLLEERTVDLVALLSLVAEEREARAVADAAPGDRVAAWSAFWRKRDPTPSTESNEEFGEFLQRLKYVLASFSKSRPGWKTDMGATYMKNGAPDKIESAQEAHMGRYVQIWYYNSKGIAYIFEDAIGTGDYRLLTTEMI